MLVRTLALAFLLGLALPAAAQSYGTSPARIGAGIDLVAIPLEQESLDAGLGLGLRGRMALPINSDLSAAASAGVHANLLGSARLTVTPQVSLIVTLPRGDSGTVRYVLGGFGGYVPLSGGGGGPTVHGGMGIALPLSETSLYFEVNPAVVVGSSRTTVVVPVRAGVIF